MPEELNPGCARPISRTVPETLPEEIESYQPAKEKAKVVLIGRKAPDFVAPAYHQGKFIQLKLSEYFGKWVLLCFYPGDFTFV